MALKDLLKRAGKGLVITAASVLAGATLGPIAATAVGSFLARSMSSIGVSVSAEVIGEVIQNKVEDSASGLMNLGRPKDIEELASSISERSGISVEDATAGLQYGLRDLQANMDDIISQLRGNQELLTQVLELAASTGVKIDMVLAQGQQTNEALDEVLRRLAAMERGLDISFRKFMGKYSSPETLDFSRLLVIGNLQRQRTTGATGFGVRYDDSLYVARTKHEMIFDRFIGDAGMTDRNIFVVLGDAGLGKTWYMARMSRKIADLGAPTFFVPLLHGLKALTSIFRVETLPALVDLIDPILSGAGENAYIFLDGLDEMDPSSISYLLGSLSSARSDYVFFILSCRCADWTSRREIVRGTNELKYYIYKDQTATDNARSYGINTPVSVLITEFTDTELRQAMTRYGLPNEVPFDLLPLLSKPYILRLSADWYKRLGFLPSPSSPEFLDLFAGGPKYADSVFRRLGILAERDSLYATVEKLIEAQCESLPLFDLPIEAESSTFTTLVSSGMLKIRIERSGTAVSLSPEFLVPLVALTVLRHQSNPDRLEEMLQRIKSFIPQKAEVVTKIVKQLTESGVPSIEPPVISVETVPVHTDTPEEPRRIDSGSSIQELPSRATTKGLSQSFTGTSSEPAPSELSSQSTDAGVLPPTTSSTYPPLVKRLMFLINDSDLQVRRAAIISLGIALSTIPNKQDRFPTIRPFLEDPDPEFRGGAAWGLVAVSASLDNDTIIGLAKDLVEDEDWSVRKAGGFASGLVTVRVDSKLLAKDFKKAFSDADGQVRSGALLGVGVSVSQLLHPDEAIAPILEFLDDSHDEVRGAAVLTLALFGTVAQDADRIISKLKEALKNGYGKMQMMALLGLGLLSTRTTDTEGLSQYLRHYLSDKNSLLRSSAALALGLLSSVIVDPKVELDALKKLLNDEEQDVKFCAGIGYSMLGLRTKQPIQELETLFKHKNEYVRAAGAIGLGYASGLFRDSQEAISQLKRMTDDSERTVRRAAIMALGMAASDLDNDESRLELLKPFAESPDEGHRRAAAVALGIAGREPEILYGLVISEALASSTSYTREECIALGTAMSPLLRFGR
ncbi:MAG: HEAT repeat domain-containing protein [Candidatus Thorarchaeota archaeon]|nr:HEAT repeat domain-containing protein [Candidatus Thorarchaeota archaeon]